MGAGRLSAGPKGWLRKAALYALGPLHFKVGEQQW